MQGEGNEELSIEELASNLSTYKEQLQQVKLLFVICSLKFYEKHCIYAYSGNREK
ncbi:unnamed protein product [Ilex paraguariensis]|uniref:Uncharacterized protein n=1 Tax=Ilex paraguariensis TaxID=185542 RepID=A0ABC8TLJ0_9AQUA